jgi:hypothetical protein
MGEFYDSAMNIIVYHGPTYDEGNECQFLRLVRKEQTPSEAQLCSILKKEWFTRVYVIQELVFATNP